MRPPESLSRTNPSFAGDRSPPPLDGRPPIRRSAIVEEKSPGSLLACTSRAISVSLMGSDREGQSRRRSTDRAPAPGKRSRPFESAREDDPDR